MGLKCLEIRLLETIIVQAALFEIIVWSVSKTKPGLKTGSPVSTRHKVRLELKMVFEPLLLVKL